MRATYKGREIAVELFGIVFPRGQAVTVTDARAREKLAAHPEFETDAKPAEPAKPAAEPPAKR